MIGNQVTVIAVDDDKKIDYYKNNLEKVLIKCGHRPIAIVAVAGNFRKGKSFLLNMFLRFLHHAEQNSNWLSRLNGNVTGFEAKGGSVRVTQGISFWSEPFFIRSRNGREVAIVLCDSQGLFDNSTPSKINSFIFGFSAVIPSMLIYNLKDHIDENSMDNLAAFAPKMGKIGSFQHVMFLIRDWNDDDLHCHGTVGGNQYVNKILSDTGVEQLNETRKIIKRHFPSHDGFLLPPPGSHVERSKSNPIEISKVDEHFLLIVDQLCKKIFIDEVEIKMNAKEGFMSSKEIIAWVEHLVKQYKEGKIEDPGTHWESDSQRVCEAAKSKSFWGYKQWMIEELKTEKKRLSDVYVSDAFLETTHKKLFLKATDEFTETTSIYTIGDEFQKNLTIEIEQIFNDMYIANNEIRKRRQAQIETEKADERERIAKIQIEKNEKERQRLIDENKRQLEEQAKEFEREMERQQEQLEEKRRDAKDKRGFFTGIVNTLVGVTETVIDSAGRIVHHTVDAVGGAVEVTVNSAGRIVHHTVDAVGGVVGGTFKAFKKLF